MKIRSILLLYSLFLLSAHHGQNLPEPKLKTAFSGRFTIGAQIPTLQNSDVIEWSTGVGTFLSLEPYLKLRWKNSFDVSFGGGLYTYNYSFTAPNLGYAVAYYNLKYEGRISKYFLTPNLPLEYLSVGIGIGGTPHGTDDLSKKEIGFTAKTHSVPRDPLYFSPHIGTYKRNDRWGYSLALQCTIYRSSDPYIYFDIEGKNMKADGSHIGNYIGLNLIIDYDLRRNPKPLKEKFPITPETSYEEREVIAKNELTVKRRKIKIYVWDHGIIDHDTVSIFINDHPIISKQLLTHDKMKVKVRLPQTGNNLTLYAHNEGSVKPNTAAIIIKVGLRKYHYVLNSTLEESEQLKIVYK